MEIIAQQKVTSPSPAQSTKQGSKEIPPPAQGDKKPQPAKQISNISLKFSVYGGDKIAFTVVDKETGNVIREVPPEEVQALAEKMDQLRGALVDKFT